VVKKQKDVSKKHAPTNIDKKPTKDNLKKIK